MRILSAVKPRFQFTLMTAFAAMIVAAILLHGVVIVPDRALHFVISTSLTIVMFAVTSRLSRYDGYNALDTTLNQLVVLVLLIIGSLLAMISFFYFCVLVASLGERAL